MISNNRVANTAAVAADRVPVHDGSALWHIDVGSHRDHRLTRGFHLRARLDDLAHDDWGPAHSTVARIAAASS